MEGFPSSSEGFAKTLKGLQVSPSEKIRLAKEAWERKDVVIPHKHEFLLEWLCNAFAKSCTPSKNLRDSSPNLLLIQEYWDLFKDMIEDIACNRRRHRKYGIVGGIDSGSTIAEHQAPAVLLRMSVIPIFTALIRLIAYNIQSASKQGRHTETHAVPALIQDIPQNAPSTDVLQSASSCFELLSSPSMSEWFQPTLEQFTPLVQTTLEALIDMIQVSPDLSTKEQRIMLSFAHTILDRFQHLIAIQPNQRKVFGVVAGRMFEALVRVRTAIYSVSGSTTIECQQAVDMILKRGLFHHEHLQEYTTGYVAGDEKSIQSYHKQLFEQIASMINSGHSKAVLDILPVLLRYFVEESRKKQRSMIGIGFDRTMESAHETEFSFFKIVYGLAKKPLPDLTEDPSDTSVTELANIMGAHNHLLSTLLDLNMYQPSNDQSTDQFVFMSTTFEGVYSCLSMAQTLSNGKLQNISLAGVVVLAQLDDRLLKPHLDSLWPVIFCPLQEAHCAALEVAKTFLEIYGKACNLEIFLRSLFLSLRKYSGRPETLESSPLFSKSFLDLLPTNVRSYLPLPQAPSILDVFAEEFMVLDSSTAIERFEPTPESSLAKRRRLNSGKPKDSLHSSNDIPSARFVTAIFIHFLMGLRITASQEKQLNQAFRRIYDHYLKSIFEPLGVNEDTTYNTLWRSELYQRRRLLPALQLHYVLCKISTQYWAGTTSMSLIERVVATFQSSSGWIDPTVLSLNRVVLQHVHLTLCITDKLDDGLVRRCKDLVDFTMTTSRLVCLMEEKLPLISWDGCLESAFGDKFIIASWQIQVNEWLDIVCRFGTVNALELIARVVATQYAANVDLTVITSPSNSITIHGLVQVLLRSSNFYEVPSFRPIFVQVVLCYLARSCIGLCHTSLERSLANKLSFIANPTVLEKQPKDITLRSAIPDILTELAKVIDIRLSEMREKKSRADRHSSMERQITDSEPTLLSLLSIMHLVPLEYFGKYERNVLLMAMAILDYFIQQYLPADATGIRCLLLTRRISNAIMTFRGDAGVLLHDPSVLKGLLNYTTWNCSTSYGIEDKDGIGQALIDITCSMVDNAVKFYMAQMYDPVQHEAASKLFQGLLQIIQEWVKESLEHSNTTFDRRISEPHIRVNIISSVCQSFVHCLEQNQRSKHRNHILGTQLADSFKLIEALFDSTQLKTTQRIRKVLALMNETTEIGHNGGEGKSEKGTLVEEAQRCLDQIELFGTIVHYRQLHEHEVTSNEDRDQCLSLTPDLFSLAQVLVQSLPDHSTQQRSLMVTEFPSKNFIHLITILMGYSCRYLHLSKAWQSTNGTERSPVELLSLLLTVSDQDLSPKDSALLKDAYLSMLGTISGDHFDLVLNWLLDETHFSGEHAVDDLVLVRYMEITFLNAHHIQKRKVRRQVSKLLSRLIQILQWTQSVLTIVGVLDILAGVCSESSFELRTWEIGLVLEGIASLMSPSTPLLYAACSTRVLTNQDTAKIFTALYHVLINVARFRQGELTTLIPVFTAILQGIFHGFKSLHASIARRQQGVETLIRSPFMLLSAGVADQTQGSRGIPVGDPLPVECAENFARLLAALGSKGISTLGLHGSGTSQESFIPGVAGSSSGSISITTDASKAFGKHAPYILLEYLSIQCSVVASISQQSLRNALLPGLYTLLDLCGDWEREMMMVGLDNTGKTLLKGLYADYLKYFKYTGR